MNDIPMPFWCYILFIIFLFYVGQWQLALINIVLLIVQVLGSIIFGIPPRDFLFILALIGLGIWLFLCIIGVCEFRLV